MRSNLDTSFLDVTQPLVSDGSSLSAALRKNEGDSEPWFALRVRPQWEKKVARILSEKGYSQFLPLYSQRRKSSSRSVSILSPLFPGYVFCQANSGIPSKIVTTPGAIGFVKFGGRPIAVDEVEMMNLQSMIVSGAEVRPWALPTVGSRVCLERGPLVGVEGILVREKTGCRVVVSISILQRAVAVEVELDWLRPLEGVAPKHVDLESTEPAACEMAV